MLLSHDAGGFHLNHFHRIDANNSIIFFPPTIVLHKEFCRFALHFDNKIRSKLFKINKVVSLHTDLQYIFIWLVCIDGHSCTHILAFLSMQVCSPG